MIAVLLPSGPPAHQASATDARRRMACRTLMSRRTPRCGLEREGRSSGERPGNAGTGVRRISQFPENSHREPALPRPACRLRGLGGLAIQRCDVPAGGFPSLATRAVSHGQPDGRRPVYEHLRPAVDAQRRTDGVGWLPRPPPDSNTGGRADRRVCHSSRRFQRREVPPAVHKESPPSLTLRDQNVVHFRRGISR